MANIEGPDANDAHPLPPLLDFETDQCLKCCKSIEWEVHNRIFPVYQAANPNLQNEECDPCVVEQQVVQEIEQELEEARVAISGHLRDLNVDLENLPGGFNPNRGNVKHYRPEQIERDLGMTAHELKYEILGTTARISRFDVVKVDGVVHLEEKATGVLVDTGYTVPGFG